jgi:mitochondrial fission protein ELM1
MPIHALVLLDGVLSHGHQSRGLLRELARDTAVETEEFFVQMHSSWMRGYLRKALSMTSQQTLNWAGHCFNWSEDQYTAPDLIVSAGDETMLLNAVLAKRYGCENIYIGRQKGVRSSWFSAVLTLDPPIMPNAVSVNLPPSRLSPERVSETFAGYLKEGGDGRGKYWGMIIGGDTAQCQYTDDDWHNLTNSMNALARANKIKWLVLTTSLTGAKAKVLLQENLKSRYVASITSYRQVLDDPLSLLAARSQRIYCGSEQLPILLDAVATGRPTVAFMPEEHKPNRQTRQLLSSLRQERLLSVVNMNELLAARLARPALPLPTLLARKQQQLLQQWRSFCLSLDTEA